MWWALPHLIKFFFSKLAILQGQGTSILLAVGNFRCVPVSLLYRGTWWVIVHMSYIYCQWKNCCFHGDMGDSFSFTSILCTTSTLLHTVCILCLTGLAGYLTNVLTNQMVFIILQTQNCTVCISQFIHALWLDICVQLTFSGIYKCKYPINACMATHWMYILGQL